jgi:hypothetical protein
MILGTAESAITIIAASIPILRTLIISNLGPPPDKPIATVKTIGAIPSRRPVVALSPALSWTLDWDASDYPKAKSEQGNEGLVGVAV